MRLGSRDVGLGCALVPVFLGATTPAEARVQIPPRDVGDVALSIGVLDGPAEEQLYRVRTPLRLADGRIVVPNGGTSEIRFFDGDGKFLTSVGREGDGPGEYRSIDWLRPYRGDSLVVFDSRLQRLTVLDGRGATGRMVSLGPGGGPVTTVPAGGTGRGTGRVFAVGVFDGGGFLARRGEISVGPGDTTAVRRDVFEYVRFDPEGRPVADLVSLPGDEMHVWAEGGSRSVRPRAFGRTTSVEVWHDRVFVADGTGFRVRVLDADGRPVGTLEADRPPRPITEADRDRWLQAELERLGDGLGRRIGEPALRAMDFPDTMPPHGDLLVGEDGSVWLEEYRPPHKEAASIWTAFDARGALAGRLRFPTGFRLTWVGGASVLGVLVDDLGVERVVLYRLPEAGPSLQGPRSRRPAGLLRPAGRGPIPQAPPLRTR